ncbi:MULTISPECIES: type II toxin-antitoxin system RelE/ParE family toxin [Corynebacterium]|uniref:Type II toxin-antitoxin system RelE/ParE family toxin n=2 Tax=Corynebacterium phoceense TaxID=1686286 RepID=A0A540R6D3_9CORY|nr:hypothetical protein EJK80_08100 [Corynebacterium phoceense]
MPSMLSRPFHSPRATRNSKGEGGFRIRVGRYRVVYTVDQGQLVIGIFTLGPRGGVNKK